MSDSRSRLHSIRTKDPDKFSKKLLLIVEKLSEFLIKLPCIHHRASFTLIASVVFLAENAFSGIL